MAHPKKMPFYHLNCKREKRLENMKKLTSSEKEHVRFMAKTNAKSIKTFFSEAEACSKLTSYIDGIWVGLIAAGFEYDEHFNDELFSICNMR